MRHFTVLTSSTEVNHSAVQAEFSDGQGARLSFSRTPFDGHIHSSLRVSRVNIHVSQKLHQPVLGLLVPVDAIVVLDTV